MRVLISGFGPFGTNKTNPSQEFISFLDNNIEVINDIEIETVLLPVTFAGAYPELSKKINSSSPDVVISLGLAEDRDHVTLERIAVNIIDARIEDNDGKQPKHERVDSLFPSAGLFTTLPIDRMYDRACEKKFKVSISNSAGTYVCNQVMFKSVAQGLKSDFRAGFIHLPANISPKDFYSLLKCFFEVL